MKELQSLLFTMQDLKYKKFSAKIIPNISEEAIIGVRVPELRKIAKQLLKTHKLCKNQHQPKIQDLTIHSSDTSFFIILNSCCCLR